MDILSVREHTSDKIIRPALIEKLRDEHRGQHYSIIEELGLTHGTVRVDMVVVNGITHGYELKSDLDTLQRLPEQMREYNSVFDKVTLVVGKKHLHEAIQMIPDWWGVMIAKISESDGALSLLAIRDADENRNKDSLAIARLLWRNEALAILEELESADGVRSKPREVIYKKLITILNQEDLEKRVRGRLFNRANWRSEKQYV